MENSAKTRIFYYSNGGSTRKLAEALAAETGGILTEVRYAKKPTKLGIVLRGCPACIRGKTVKVAPFEADVTGADRVVVMAPVWASHPAPPFNNIIQALPAGTAVELRLVSSGGDTSDAKNRTIARVEAAGCAVADYLDVKAPASQ